MSKKNGKIAKSIREMEGKTGVKVITYLEEERIGEKILWKQGDMVFPFLEEVVDNRVICTEEGKIFVESVRPQPKIVICGGGHISIPLVQIANMLEFEVTVLEDRPLFADHARNARASIVICEPFEEGLKKIEGDEATYFVIVTRGHRYDTLCLEQILKKKSAYIGMIGSQKRVCSVKEMLLGKGYKKEQLESIYSPIGLKIKAETPTEIAISILGEIIRCKNERQSFIGYTKEIVKYFVEEWTEESNFAMVTIIARTGSAPRGVGTKMLVLEDGRIIGTIGGGCVEAEVRKSALSAIRKEDTFIICVDLNQKEAEEEGMACGGRIELLIEA